MPVRTENIRPAIDRSQLYDLFDGVLAEDYDGIGQHVFLSLGRGANSTAIKVQIASGDFGHGVTFPAGTKVVFFSNKGRLQLLTLGSGGGGSAATTHQDSDVDVIGYENYIYPGSIDESSVGTPLVYRGRPIEVTGIASGEALGTPTVASGTSLDAFQTDSFQNDAFE